MTHIVEDFLAATRGRAEAEVAKTPLLVTSEVRLLREAIGAVLEGHPGLSVVGSCKDVGQALSALRDKPGATVLLDASFPNRDYAIREIHVADPSAPILVFAISETEIDTVDWATAEAAGYIPATADAHVFAWCVERVNRRGQACPATIAPQLLQRVGSSPCVGKTQLQSRVATDLSAREQQISRMIAEGLSNKEIARQLHIGLSTTKTHVHNLLVKLDLQRRGQIANWAHKRESRWE